MAETERFSNVLRGATRLVHERAEGAAFIGKLMSGELALAGFAELAVQHFSIYTALEEVSDAMRTDPVAGPFVIDGLRRVPALTKDLDFLLGSGWQSRVAPNAATGRYCERLHNVAGSWPGGFVAHHYTRYLGDISGGQVIRSKLRTFHGTRGLAPCSMSSTGSAAPPSFAGTTGRCWTAPAGTRRTRAGRRRDQARVRAQRGRLRGAGRGDAEAPRGLGPSVR
ncbi:heme oxygenase (biliverdin-producing) [Fodinicola acaciae]|uniref:biliverdin-producing heme oxygenase n=1 Tax=Fodinicola acaciae TaxID=2681555 RepID=UPI001C9E93A0|nr:biliverdin-producing heme oxygenase [Fodinicola acaciae]